MRYFPLFADLHGRRVLVVGGGAVAERKVRLLLEAGAQVRLVAPEVTAWLGEHPSIEVHREQFGPQDLDGAVLAIAATDDRAVNEAVATAGRDRNVLVNVVDVAELSSFIVPAIVDRSPLVIAVSTGGVAPVLARLVRERLESLLDGSFGQLAGLLERWRSRIKGGLPDVNSRRRFYETVVRGQVSALVRNNDLPGAERELERTLQHADAPRRGSVVLVGAGPGDAGLLTLNALRALQEADVILHDRLVADEVLNLARRDADRICVGKMAGGHSVSQGRINELLLRAGAARPACRAVEGRRSVHLRPRRRRTGVPRAARHSVRGRSGHHGGHCLWRLRRNPAHAPRTRAVGAVRDGAQRRLDRRPRLGHAGPRTADACALHGCGRARARFATS